MLSVILQIPVKSQALKVSFNSIPKSGTILMFTHQDDDLIWMLPFWNISEKFIGAAMPTTPRFEEIIHNQQIYMDNHGYNIDYESNWINPWGKVSNIEYQSFYWGGGNPAYSYLENDHVITAWDNSDLEIVRRETNKIKAKIEQYIANPDVSRIITHNNWGEYGHNHHKAVNKAVRELAVKYRKDVWMLGCDNGDFVDINVPSGLTYTLGNFDGSLFNAVRDIYIYPNSWWTWNRTYTPSGDHKFIKIVDAGNDLSSILTGENVTVPGPPQYETGSYIFDGVDDYIKVRVYPNPFHERFIVRIDSQKDNLFNLSITDFSGRLVLNGLKLQGNTENIIDITLLPGIYFLTINSHEFKKLLRIVVY